MEFLKGIFGDQALSYQQLTAALKDSKEIELVNAADGAYVPKADLEAKDAALQTANSTIKTLQETVKAFDGKDPNKLEADLGDLRKKYDDDVAALKLNSALDLALVGAGALDVRAVKPFLSMDGIKLEGDKLAGLEAQLEGLKKDKAFLFAEGDPNPAYTPPGGKAPNTVTDLKSALAEKYQAQ